MQFRPVTGDERLELMEMQAQAFFFTYDREKYKKEMAGSDPRQSGRGCFDESGKMVAGLDLIPFDCWFDGTTVGMAGVGGVATWPEHRNGGHVRGLMDACLREQYDRGDVFSFLYPFSYQYYRKFGYEVCNRITRIKAPTEPLRALRQPGHAERFIPGEGGTDPSPIVEVYNDFAQCYNLCVDREGWRWHGMLELDAMKNHRQAYVWYGEDGRPGAYLILVGENEHDRSELRVVEAAWRSGDSLKGLLGYIGGFCSNLKALSWEIPPDLDPSLFWPNCYDVKTEVAYEGMNRVVNAQKALRGMAKPEGKGTVKVAVRDSFLPANTGTYKIDWENGESRVRRVKDGNADLECSELALAQLVTGYLPLEQLRVRNDVAVNGKAEELGKLFVKKNIYILEKF